MSVDEVYKEQDYGCMRTLSGCACVHVVKRHAMVDVLCVLVIRVVIGVHVLL